MEGVSIKADITTRGACSPTDDQQHSIDSIDEVIHHRGDTVHTAKPLVETGLIARNHRLPPSAESRLVSGYAVLLTESPRRIVWSMCRDSLITSSDVNLTIPH